MADFLSIVLFFQSFSTLCLPCMGVAKPVPAVRGENRRLVVSSASRCCCALFCTTGGVGSGLIMLFEYGSLSYA